jgi:hypothetical protein
MRKGSRSECRYQPGVDRLDERYLLSPLPAPLFSSSPPFTEAEVASRTISLALPGGNASTGPAAISLALATGNVIFAQDSSSAVVRASAFSAVSPAIALVVNVAGLAPFLGGYSVSTGALNPANIPSTVETARVATAADPPIIAAPGGVLPLTGAIAALPAMSNGPAELPLMIDVKTGGGWIAAALLNSVLVGPPFVPLGVSPAGSVPATPARGEVAGRRPSGDGQRIAPPGDPPREVPAPLGAGLITQFLPFDHASLEESVSRFLEHFKDRGVFVIEPADPLSKWVLVVTVTAAIEATRRWRQRHAASETSDPGTWRGPVLPGLS